MGQPLPTDSIGAPSRWLLVFNRKAETWWGHIVACGRYKHVRCFGWVEAVAAYVFFDVQFEGTTIRIARGDGARRLMLEWTTDADVLSIAARPLAWWPRWWMPLLCTTSVAHLIGLRGGALRPDRLFADCLRNGAVPLGRTQSTDASPRPDAAVADEDGAAAAGAGATD